MTARIRSLGEGKIRPTVAAVGCSTVPGSVVVAALRGAGTDSAGDQVEGMVLRDGSNLRWAVGYLCLYRTCKFSAFRMKFRWKIAGGHAYQVL